MSLDLERFWYWGRPTKTRCTYCWCQMTIVLPSSGQFLYLGRTHEQSWIKSGRRKTVDRCECHLQISDLWAHSRRKAKKTITERLIIPHCTSNLSFRDIYRTVLTSSERISPNTGNITTAIDPRNLHQGRPSPSVCNSLYKSHAWT